MAKPFSDVADLGVAFKISETGQPHVAILYRLDGGSPMLCHLMWHHRLAITAPSDDYVWAESGLDDVNRRIIAARCHTMLQNADKVPFGIDFRGRCFDDDGRFIAKPPGQGLTCATFVMAVFADYGVALLRTEEWPLRADDEQWQKHILDLLEQDDAEHEHVQAAREDIGRAKRFRPQEVAVAVPRNDTPLGFADANALAQELVALVAAARLADSA